MANFCQSPGRLKIEVAKTIALLTISAACSVACQATPSGVARDDRSSRPGRDSTTAALGALGERPVWLFTAEDCPADVFPGREAPLVYSPAACVPDLQWCIDRCRAGEASGCYAAAGRVEEL